MEKKTYLITFKAELSEDDVRAMNKCFYDAMNESMEISPCWDLKLEPVKEPKSELPAWEFKKDDLSLEELIKVPMRHISAVKACFEACKSSAEVYKVINLIPSMFGDFQVEFDNESEGFKVFNTYYDGMLNDYYDEEYWFDYPEDWKYSDEDEED